MSISQTRNFRNLKALLQQLRTFGLNPHDWQFVRTSLAHEDQFELRHRRDEDFRVTGRVRRLRSGRAQWCGLAVASL